MSASITVNLRSISKIGAANRAIRLSTDAASISLGLGAGYATSKFVASRLVGGAVAAESGAVAAGLGLGATATAAAPIVAGVIVGAAVAYGAAWAIDKVVGEDHFARASDLENASKATEKNPELDVNVTVNSKPVPETPAAATTEAPKA